MDFLVTFSKGSTTDFTGGWYSAEGVSIHLGDLAKFFEISTRDIRNFNELASFTVVAAGIGYDATSGKFSMSIRTADGNEAFLCVGKDDNQNWAFIFGLSTSQAFKLSEIPGVGPCFAAAKEIKFQQLALAVCSGCFSSYSIPLSTELPSVPNCDVTSYVSFPPTTQISPVASGTALFLPGPSIGAAGIVDISSSGSKCLANAGTLLPDTTQVAFQAQYGDIDQVSLSASLASDAQIPDGVGGSLELTSVTLSLNWASSALALQLAGDINFRWQSNTTIQGKVTLNIDETEADATLLIGILPLPDALTSIVGTKIQLSNVALELGVFFEPPGFNFGFMGDIALGGHMQPDQFAIVLDVIGDAPDPVYLSFYCAKVSLSEFLGLFVSSNNVVTGFTDNIQISNLSFYWCEKTGIILPDGTIPPLGLAFSGNMDIYGYHFYGALNLISGNYNGLFQADPISVSVGGTEVFSLSASSRQTVSPAAALAKYNATTSDAAMNNEVVFKPNGSPPSPPSPPSLTGPFISFQTNRDFSATALFDISLMDIATTALSVVLRDDGTSLTFTMNDSIDNFSSINANINITKWNNLSARVTGNCQINSISTPLGTITIETPDIAVNAGMNVSFDDFSGSIGTSLSLPSPLPSLSINLSLNTPFTFSDVKQLIINEAVTQIEGLLNDARQWLTYINNRIVQFSGDIINVLNTTFQKSPWEIISLFSDGAFPNVIAGGPIAIARAICGEFYDNGSTSALQKLMSSFSAVSNIPGGIFSPSVFISALNVAGWTPKTIPGIGVLGSVTENVPFGWSVSAIIEARMSLSEEQLIPGLQAIIGSDSVTIANDLLQSGCNPINVTRAVYNAFPTSQTVTNLTSVLNGFYTGSPQQILQQIGQTFMDANIPLTVAENAASNVSGDPVSTIKSIWSNLKGIGSSIWSGISGTVSKIWHAITSWWPP